MLAIIIIIIGIVTDQLSKHLVVKHLKGQPSKVIIDNFLRFTYVENSGAAFGILQNQTWFFIIVTLISLAILAYVLLTYYNKLSKWNIVSLSLIVGGTIGNFIDRLRYGYVVDFISIRLFNRYNFAVFNIADSLIVIGGIMLILSILFADSDL